MHKFYLIAFLFILHNPGMAQGVGIGTNIPDSTAKLEIRSDNKGFLPPRMTFAQRNAIQHPATGLIIWCTDCDELQVFNGSMWKNMSGTAASGPALPGVRICYSSWMLKNINVRTYRNGDSIPVVTDPLEWANLTTGAMCWYNNDSANGNTYGALYNWYALNDPRGLAPAGWHVPTINEWTTLVNCLGGENTAGGKLKAVSALWTSTPNVGATNSSGFTALPGGFRDGNSGNFFSLGTDGGFWWTSSAYDSNNAWNKYVVYDGTMVLGSPVNKTYGLSLRCIKD